MKEKIQAGSLAIIAIVLTLAVGYFVTSKYIAMQVQINSIISFINNANAQPKK